MDVLTQPFVGPREIQFGPVPANWYDYVTNLPAPPAHADIIVPTLEEDLQDHQEVIKIALLGATPQVFCNIIVHNSKQ